MSLIKKIFLIDDDLFFSHLLQDHLAEFPQFEVTHFDTGEAALTAIYSNTPDIVFLDYNLNDIDPKAANGIQILAEIKKRIPATQVIMLSGQNKYGLAIQTLTKGASHYVIKDRDAFKNIDAILLD
jgi:DNA-binding NarL/FixJ family response regulator